MFNNKNDKHIYNIDKVRPCDFFYCEVFFLYLYLGCNISVTLFSIVLTNLIYYYYISHFSRSV